MAQAKVGGNTARTRYVSVNGKWPEGPLSKPTGQEAISAVKRLYRLAMGKAYAGKFVLTSGRRHTWPRHGEYRVNPDQSNDRGGWKSLVHGVSHYCHRRLHPDKSPHDFRHAVLERQMIEHIVNNGWLDGTLLRPEKNKVKPPLIEKRAEKSKKLFERAERDLAAAQKRLRKWKAKVKYYDTRLAA